MEARIGNLELNGAPGDTLPPPSEAVGAKLTALAKAGELRKGGKAKAARFKKTLKQTTPASAKRPVDAAFTGEGATTPGRARSRKKLEVDNLASTASTIQTEFL